MAHADAHDTPTENPAEAAEGNVVLAFVAALCVAGVGLLAGAPRAADAQPKVAQTDQAAPLALGSKIAVASAAPEASSEALKVLQEGGNAFDAMVTASFVVSVVRPHSTGLGGGGFVLYYEAENNDAGCLDGREAAPAAATPDMFLTASGDLNPGASKRGPLAAGTPGLVALLWRLHSHHGSEALVRKYGSKLAAWRRLVEPAIRYAREGFSVPAELSRSVESHKATLSEYPSSAGVFLTGGRVPATNSILKQPALANTLEAIASGGAKGFYEGWVAEELVRTSREAGGVMTLRDLEEYEVKTRDYVDASYRGQRVISFPLPSSGGTTLVEMLHMLEGYELKGLTPGSPQHTHLLAEVMRRAYADRNALMADPDTLSSEQLAKIKELLTPEYARRIASGIDLNRATPSSLIKSEAATSESDHTTHISIVDAAGNALASTQTINTGLGSCFVAGKTGVLLNNEMDDFTAKVGEPNAYGAIQSARNLPAPRKRPLSSMSPTIVFDSNRQVQAVLGTPGGTKIITTVLQLTSNLVDFKMSPGDAMAAPRMHHQHLPDEILLEAPLKSTSAALSAMGHRVKVLGPDKGLCNAQIVVKTAQGWVAVSDPRGSGRPAAE